MRRASIHHAIGSMLWVAVSAAEAIGFGRVSNTTSLGQPLNFEATVRLATDETLTPECVAAEVFSGDNKLVQPLVRVQLDSGADGAERKVRVRTTTVIDEPVVTVLLTLGCDNKTTRKFVAFIDPPALGLAQAGTVGEPPAAPAAVEPSPAAVASGIRPAADPAAAPAPVPVAAAQPAARAPSSAPRAAARRSSNTATTAQARRTKAPTFRTARAAVQPGPRLKLEPAPSVVTAKASAPEAAPVAPVVPPVAPVVPPVVAAAASAVLLAEAPKPALEPVVPDPLAKERARLLALEESLTRVRDETQAAQKALASLQAKVKEAEAQRYANPLVYALAAVSALLALAVAGLWRRQSRARNEPKWWGTVAPSPAVPSRLPEPVDDDVPSRFAEDPELPKPAAKVVASPEPVKQVWVDSRQTEPSPDLLPEPRRDLSVEELIDLEQQAEFFVVLGQDDAAIDLLMGHVRSTGGISPLPYLKLLEIYRRRGDRSAYERIRERFNRRFNAYAPDWDADLQQGRSLEDYPATIARLEALWVMPSRVMETLEASLFRRDETEEAFDLPAYRELLFLYAVARDFAHKADDSSAVDLLLPMDTDAPNAPVSRLMASMPAMATGRNPGAPTGGSFKVESDAEAGSVQESGGSAKQHGDMSLDLGPLDLVEDPLKPGSIIRR
jgi:pilus assembly protein FimV